MKNILILWLMLFVAWLLWSGHFTLQHGLVFGFGLASCSLVAWLSHKMKVVEDEGRGLHLQLGIRPFLYLPWLVKEIILSNIDVAKRVLSPNLEISPTMATLKPELKTDVGRVTYANSITLTPGTVAIQAEDGEILVHGLTREGVESLIEGEMERRVRKVEGGS